MCVCVCVCVCACPFFWTPREFLTVFIEQRAGPLFLCSHKENAHSFFLYKNIGMYGTGHSHKNLFNH